MSAENKPAAGTKHDKQKPNMALLAPLGIVEEAKGMTYGASKYSQYNWREGILVTRYLAAALRHIFAFIGGENLDPESGVSHLGHAKCNLGMAIQTLADRPDLDDRYKGTVFVATKSDITAASLENEGILKDREPVLPMKTLFSMLEMLSAAKASTPPKDETNK